MVYVVEGNRAARRDVALGPLIEGQGVVVEGGLAAGDRLIVEGQRRVSPGQRVEVAEGQSGLGAVGD